MENLSLEEKIASFKKKIDELDQSAPPPPPNAGDEHSAEGTSLYEAPELGNGKIAAMKQRLVRKGLSVSGDGASAAEGGEAPAAAGEATNGGGGKGNVGGVGGGGGGGGGALADSDEEDGKPDDEEKAAKLAAEFETGKIAAMKNRLVSKGLGIDGDAKAKADAAAAAKAAHAKAKAEAAAAYAAKRASSSLSSSSASEGAGAKREGGGGDGAPPATEEAKTPETAGDDPKEEEPTSSTAADVAADTAVDAAAEQSEPTKLLSAESSSTVAADVSTPDESDKSEAVALISSTPAGEEEQPVSAPPAAAAAMGDGEVVAKDETGDAPPAAAASAATTPSEAGDDVQGAEVAPSSPSVTPASDSQQEESTPAAAKAAPADAPAAAPAAAPADAATPQEAAVTAAPSASAAPAAPASAGEKETKAGTAGPSPSPKIEGFNVAASKAKAALAAAKSRSRSRQRAPAAPAAAPAAASTPAAPSAGEAPQRQRQPHRRDPTPDRKARSNKRSGSTGSRGVSPARKPSPSTSDRKARSQKRSGSVGRGVSPARKPSPSTPSRGRRQSAQQRLSAFSTPTRVSPADGDVSRATPVVAVTPGLHPPPPGPGAEPSHQRRRTASPARKKRVAESRPAALAAAAVEVAPPAPVMTPASAEASGNRLHEQAREARERLERRRTEGGGASPPFLCGSPLPFTPAQGPALTLTPASAEASGSRLHEQAREARERLERRRKERAVAAPLVPMPGLVPFTPRRWSAPRAPVGSAPPAVGGVDRLEILYQDAIQRNSKLEMARRAEEEKPRECTFTPEISRRGRSLVRGSSGDESGGGGEGAAGVRGAGLSSTFDALYRDAQRRQAKMEALQGAQKQEERPPSPVITAMARQAGLAPIDVRMQEDAQRWMRRWQELEEKKLEREREGCTFMPNFSIGRSSSAPRLRPRRSSSGAGGGGGRGSPGGITAFVERSEKFLETRERNLEKLKQEAEERERALATFKPRILPWTGDDAISSSSGVSGAGGGHVFDRLLRAAENQEMNKAALKEEFLRREREQFNHFEPRLPTRKQEGPTTPLDARLQKSTEEWVKSKALREQRRHELEAEQCTFRPSLGGGGGRRSSSVEPGARGKGPRPVTPTASTTKRRDSVGPAAATAFAARETAFQDAKEKRLAALRKEKEQLELQEATFQPVIGAEGRLAASRDVSSASQTKAAAPATLRRQDSIGFKSQGSGPSRSRENSATTISAPEPQPQQQAVVTPPPSPPPPQNEEEDLVGVANAEQDVKMDAPVEAAVEVAGPSQTGAVDDEAEKQAAGGQGVDVGELSARLQKLAAAASCNDEEDAGDDSDVLPVPTTAVSHRAPQLEQSDVEGQEEEEAEEEEMKEVEEEEEEEEEHGGNGVEEKEEEEQAGEELSVEDDKSTEEVATAEYEQVEEEEEEVEEGEVVVHEQEEEEGEKETEFNGQARAEPHALEPEGDVVVSDNSVDEDRYGQEPKEKEPEGVAEGLKHEVPAVLSLGADDSAAEDGFGESPRLGAVAPEGFGEGAQEQESGDLLELHETLSGEDEEVLLEVGGEEHLEEEDDENVEKGEKEEEEEGEVKDAVAAAQADSSSEEQFGAFQDAGGDSGAAVAASAVTTTMSGSYEEDEELQEEEDEEDEEEVGQQEEGVAAEDEDAECEGAATGEEEEEEGHEGGATKEEEESEAEDDQDEQESEEEESDEESYAYTNGAYSGPEASSQTSRSLEDFDRAQREIAEKMKNLGL